MYTVVDENSAWPKYSPFNDQKKKKVFLIVFFLLYILWIWISCLNATANLIRYYWVNREPSTIGPIHEILLTVLTFSWVLSTRTTKNIFSHQRDWGSAKKSLRAARSRSLWLPKKKTCFQCHCQCEKLLVFFSLSLSFAYELHVAITYKRNPLTFDFVCPLKKKHNI